MPQYHVCQARRRTSVVRVVACRAAAVSRLASRPPLLAAPWAMRGAAAGCAECIDTPVAGGATADAMPAVLGDATQATMTTTMAIRARIAVPLSAW